MPVLSSIDSYWVLPNQLMAGAYPGSPDPEIARQKLAALLNAKLDCFIDLTYPGDTFYAYGTRLKQMSAELGGNAEYFHFPIMDCETPAPELMSSILDKIDEKLASGKHVYIHCVAGIGRTGTTIGCYLVRHNICPNGNAALEYLQVLRRGTLNWWHLSPETEEQVEFVKNWPLGQ